MAKTRTIGVSILGVFHIVFGTIGILFWTAVLIWAISGGIVEQTGLSKGFFMFNSIIGLIMPLLLLLSGIGILMLRQWGRILSVCWAIMSMLFILTGTIFALAQLRTLSQIELIGGRAIAVVIVVGFIRLVYPIITLVVVTLPGIAGEFTRYSSQQQRFCPRCNAPMAPGQTQCPLCAISQKIGEDTIITSRKIGGDRITESLWDMPGKTVSLQQIGGRQHGKVTTLIVKDPVGQPISNIIGIDTTCKLVITGDPTISRLHCDISEDNIGYLYIADLNSCNGTYVIRGDQPKTQIKGKFYLLNGDVIVLGNTQLRVWVNTPPRA